MSADPTGLPFQEQLRFLRGKASVPTQGWRDVMREGHDHAFMVAGAMKADLLNDLRVAVTRAIEEGKTLDWFQKNFEEIAGRHGWEYKGTASWRSKVILETNYLTSYAAGRHAQQTDPEFLKQNPFWEWRHGDSVHPRPQHLAWNGMVLDATDPFWAAHYPPCGWGCKCLIFANDKEGIAERGLKISERPPNPLLPTRKGEALPGVDIGFDYTPGATVTERMRPIINTKLKELPKPISADLKKELMAYLKETESKPFAKVDTRTRAPRAPRLPFSTPDPYNNLGD